MAHYCLHQLHILPSQFLGLPVREKAFITASILSKVDEEKKKQRELERKKKKR